jgi:hypothetical protein
MHNGPQLPTPMIDVDKSDTHQYVKWILRPMLAQNPELLYNADWKDMIEESIGSDKLLFLDGSNGKFTIINEDQGESMQDMWLSNTYSIQRGMGSDYDVETDTITKTKPITYYGNYNRNNIYKDDWEWEYGSTISRGVSKATPKKSIEEKIELCDEGTDYKLHDLCDLDQSEISEVIYHNPTGTAKMLSDIVNADEVVMYDAIDMLIDIRSYKGGTYGNK